MVVGRMVYRRRGIYTFSDTSRRCCEGGPALSRSGGVVRESVRGLRGLREAPAPGLAFRCIVNYILRFCSVMSQKFDHLSRG